MITWAPMQRSMPRIHSEVQLRLRAGQDFLKPQIIAQRVPFPTCPQIGKRDAVIGVIDRPQKKVAIEKGELA
jgi:hypothetical protein